MTAKKKLKMTMDEALALLDDADRIEEETLKMTDEEIYADLENSGVSLQRLDARFAEHDAMIAETTTPKEPAKQPARPPFLRTFGAGFGLDTVVSLVTFAVLLSLGVIGRCHPDPAELRNVAFIERGQAHWDSCFSA